MLRIPRRCRCLCTLLAASAAAAASQRSRFDPALQDLPRKAGMLEECRSCVGPEPGPGPPPTFCWSGTSFVCSVGDDDCSDNEQPGEASHDDGSSCSAYVCYDPEAFSCPAFHECWGASGLDGDEPDYACFVSISAFQGPALLVSFALMVSVVLAVGACVKVCGSRGALEATDGTPTSRLNPFSRGPRVAPLLGGGYSSAEALRQAAVGVLNFECARNAVTQALFSIIVLHFAVIHAGPSTMWLSAAPLLVALALRLLVLIVSVFQIGSFGRATRLHLLTTFFTVVAAVASALLMALTGSDSRTWLYDQSSFAPPGQWFVVWIPLLSHIVAIVVEAVGLGWPTSEVHLEAEYVKVSFLRIRPCMGILCLGNSSVVRSAATWTERLEVSSYVTLDGTSLS